MNKTGTPLRLWDFCTQYVAELRTLTAQPLFSLHGRTPYELVTGNTPDISEYISFSWYQPVYYLDNTNFPEEKERIGRWIGVAHNIGQALCFWILPKSGAPIARTTVKAITAAEMQTDVVKEELIAYDNMINRKLGDQSISDSDLPFEIGSADLQKALADADYEDDGKYDPQEPEAERPDLDDLSEEVLDNLLSAEVVLPKDGLQFIGKVVGRKRDSNGELIGRANSNPILDTRVYKVEFPDGTINEYSANILSEAIYSQVDPEGNRFLLLKEIVDHEKGPEALSLEDALVINQSGSRNKQRKYTSKGWSFKCPWADGSTSWELLRNLKDSNPLEVAEYVETQGLSHEPAFVWWVKDTLHRKKRTIQKVKTRYWQRTHKFGIRLPKSVAEALKLDEENGNNLWHDAI